MSVTMQAERYIGADGQAYRVWRTSKDDTSPIHLTYPTGYNARCSLCWLGAAHSEAAHQAEIADHKRKAKS